MLDVQPHVSTPGGLGRGFIARDLLKATNLDDAMIRITRPNQCVGHNYQVY